MSRSTERVRSDLDLGEHLLALDLSLGAEHEPRSQLRLLRKGDPHGGEYRERRRQRDQLRPAEREPCQHTDGGESRIDAKLRRGGALHERGGSTAGVGTCASSSPTMSSARRFCTQSSGRSVRRWASAATATAFTSSGTT